MSAGLNPTRVVLANGVTLLAKQTRRAPAVTIDLAFRFGASADPTGQPGAAYLLSRVLDRGTATRSTDDIAELLDSRGIALTLSVGRERFSLSCTCLAEDFEPVLALIADVVMAPSVPAAELETRRGQVLTALRQEADNPASRATDAFMSLLYGAEHPFGRPIRGNVSTVEALTRDDLRSLHRARFAPEGLIIAIVGDVETSRSASCAARVFGEWNAVTPPLPPLQAPPGPARRHLQTVPMMNKAQADIAYGFPAIARHDRSWYAWVLMNNVLGQYGLGGRLGDSIRERQGMAYYVYSSLEPAAIPGPLSIRAGVAGHNVDRTIASIDEELRRLHDRGITGRELADSRQSIVGSLPRSLETDAGIAGFLLNAEMFSLGLDYDRRLPTLFMLPTIDDVNEAARALDPERATIAVAGPYQAA